MKEVMFGCAEADITPAYPVRTLGFSREDEWSQGVESPLLVQTAVWKSKEEICCLITLDHIGFSGEGFCQTWSFAGESNDLLFSYAFRSG